MMTVRDPSMERKGPPKGARGKWVAVMDIPFPKSENALRAAVEAAGGKLAGGWDGSYHDAHYHTMSLVAFDQSPARARHRVRRVHASVAHMLKETSDSARMRFEARAQVREGD